MLKIAFIEPHLKIFGGIRRVIELSNRLVARGHAVTIYHPEGTPCEWMPCRARVCRSDIALESEYDVVLYNDPNPLDFQLAHEIRARLKIFYVLELYETPLLTGFKPMLWRPRNERTRYMKRCLRSEHVKLANASWLVSWLKQNMAIEAELLLGGVNHETFHPFPGIERGPGFRILCSGDPRPRKGTQTIRDAVELARREHPEIELDTYHGLGLSQERLGQKYASADLFIEASSQAGWNNPVAEAMACGVPVLCSDIGGVQDFAYHDRTAWLVPPRDSEALARALVSMIRDEELRRRLSLAALARMREFDWDASAERLEAIVCRRLEENASACS